MGRGYKDKPSRPDINPFCLVQKDFRILKRVVKVDHINSTEKKIVRNSTKPLGATLAHRKFVKNIEVLVFKAELLDIVPPMPNVD
ncbi:hypothetical protein TNCV_1310691 [Trichonephila clavipes]|nr:hypothetical protein TNCV_1310691 [Trichonephila clavipes]